MARNLLGLGGARQAQPQANPDSNLPSQKKSSEYHRGKLTLSQLAEAPKVPWLDAGKLQVPCRSQRNAARFCILNNANPYAAQQQWRRRRSDSRTAVRARACLATSTAYDLACAQLLTEKLAAPKQPVKRLPASVELPAEATVEDLKKLIAQTSKIGDYNRIGLFDPSTRKTLKNRKARVFDEQNVAAAGEVLVKDLGPQIAWRTVFLIEYLGPILIHVLVVAARPYIYRDAGATAEAMSFTQWLSFGMIVAHFVKRELETLFVHKFSANTMPVFNIFKNSVFYWALSGLLCALSIYHPRSLAARADLPVIDAVGTALYLFAEMGNATVHLYLSSLRSPGGTERQIPSGYGFGLVTCPNYMFEILAWVGIIVASRDWAVAIFISVGAAQMYTWARGKESAYRKEFGDKYKKKRYVILPGLL